MATSKKTSSNSTKSSSVGKIAGTAGAILSVVELLPRIVGAVQPVVDPLARKNEGKENAVVVPNLYKKDFLLTVEEATELLSNYGLKVLASKIQVGDANPKYRSCFDKQVVDSAPKQGQKVAPGSTVILKYVTQDVIDASQLIFDEAQKHKAEVKQVKIEKRTARVERTKIMAADTAKKAKDGLLKVVPHGKRTDSSEGTPTADVEHSELET